MDVEKNRTLFFADNLEFSRQALGRCTVATVGTMIGPAGSAIILPDAAPEADPPAAGWRQEPAVGRFDGLRMWDGQPGLSRTIEAYIFPNLQKSHTMVTWQGQNFGAFATQWENQHSPLVNPSIRPEPTPVIDACGLVVGYYLRKVSTNYLFTDDGGAIFYASQLTSGGHYNFHAESIVGRDLYITAAENVERYTEQDAQTQTPHTRVSAASAQSGVSSTHVVGGYKYRVQADKWADLLLDIDGYVQVLDTYGDAEAKTWERKYDDAIDRIPLIGYLLPRAPLLPSEKCRSDDWQDDEQMDAICSAEMRSFLTDSVMLLMDLVTLGDSNAVRALIDIGEQTAKRGMRTTVLAMTLEVRLPEEMARPVERLTSDAIRRVVLPDGQLAEASWLRVVKGYDPVMGIPQADFEKMVAAAQEANGIAVFRANKQAAIPLIEQGAHPKPKYYNAFKTSAETGVLTASKPADILTVYQHGDYVVADDLIPRRTIAVDGKSVTQELKLDRPYWKLEKGQVIKPDGIPIVGDYDLLGFLPNESKGRVIAGVHKDYVRDSLKVDWSGPDVQRYQAAVNAKFDQPRVLHGAQDQFVHSQFGGLTNDVAYAVYGDGSAVILQGRQGQEAFYGAYNRQTAMGSYPRPAASTPVVDELAKRRAAKARGR